MGIRIAHISDIHFRGLSRHNEYIEYSERVFARLKEENIDLIWIGGDIAHSKVQGISPEFIKVVGWWFTEIAKIAPTHVMLGNHDGLVHNLDRLDAISPILDALNNKNIFLYKNSGVYTAKTKNGEVDFCVFSPFDNDWDKAKPAEYRISIACYHGVVYGAKTDTDWVLNSGKPHTIFAEYDYAFLGDIHKMQDIDKEGRISYSGSYIQQNFGEEMKKGFLIWDIDSKESFTKEYVTLESSKPYITFVWEKDVKTTISKGYISNGITSIPTNARVRIQVPYTLARSTIKSLEAHLRKMGHNGYVKIHKNIDSGSSEVYNKFITNKSIDLFSIDEHKKLFVDWVSTSEFRDSFKKEDTKSAMDLLKPILEEVKGAVESPRNIEWTIKRVEWDNIFAYGEDNYIDFTTDTSAIYGIFGPNGVGKSTVAAVIMYALYNSTDRGAMSNGLLINSSEDTCEARVYLQMGNEDIKVTRRTERVIRKSRTSGSEKESFTTKLDLEKMVDGKWKDLSGEQRRDTDKILKEMIGTAEDFTTISLSSQGKATEFVEYGGAKKRDALVHLLDLKHIDSFYKSCREKSNEDRASLKYLGNSDDSIENIGGIEKKIKEKTQEELEIRSQIEKLESKLSDYKQIEIGDTASKWKILTNKASNLEKNKIDATNTLEKLRRRIKDLEIEKAKHESEIESELDGSTLEVLESKFNNIKEIVDNRKILIHKAEILNKERASLIKKQDLLNGIPCGESFPMCPYIKDAFSARDKVVEIEDSIEKTNNLLVGTEEYSDKLDYYSNKIDKIKISLRELEYNNKNIKSVQTDIESYEEKINELSTSLESINAQIDELSSNNNNEELRIQKEIKSLEKEISDLQFGSLVTCKTEISILKSSLKESREKLETIQNLEKKMRIWDMLSSYVSPSGATQMILKRQLPVINSIISETIDDSIDFGITMRMEESSKLEVYLKFANGERSVETASGMQKLIAAIAIRAALHSITPIPKCDMLIIDEGFGALDPDNLESCLNMFEMYKKTYKNIILISHIDSVKEAVDVTLEVGKRDEKSILRYE